MGSFCNSAFMFHTSESAALEVHLYLYCYITVMISYFYHHWIYPRKQHSRDSVNKLHQWLFQQSCTSWNMMQFFCCLPLKILFFVFFYITWLIVLSSIIQSRIVYFFQVLFFSWSNFYLSNRCILYVPLQHPVWMLMQKAAD